MLENIEVTIHGKKYKISRNMTLQELSANFASEFKHPIILARVDNRLKALMEEIHNGSTIEFLDLSSKEGHRVHISGLTFVMIYAVKKLYGKDANVEVLHSIDKGIYIETNFKLTETKLKEIKEKMQSIIEADMPITKVVIDRDEALKYYKEMHDAVKAAIMSFNTNNYITLYRLGNYYNYFYNLMPSSTGVLKEFDLTFISEKGFCLRFPTVYIPDKIKAYKHHPGMFYVFEMYRKWTKLLRINNSADLNKLISTGNADELIRMNESLQNTNLLQVAKMIYEKRKIKIVLIAGPSSSGKTTTSKKLCMCLKSFGLNPKVISMDDYFKERANTPKDKEGKYDFESLEAMDIKLFDKQMEALLANKKVTIPKYNFIAGKKDFAEELQIDDDDILVIEGIHALDTSILTNIPRNKKYKIYISPLTQINLDEHNRISTTDNRLLRRIVRDNRTRGYSVEKTLEIWDSVRNGEEKYIFPFQDEADTTINTALIYEIGVLKTYVEPLLYSVPSDSYYYEEAKRLLKFIRMFFPISPEAIPQDSVLREFIGRGCFHE